MPAQGKNKSPRRLTIGLAAVMTCAAMYFLPLTIAFLDEAVFHTHFVAKTLPHWAGDVFKSVYPFLGK